MMKLILSMVALLMLLSGPVVAQQTSSADQLRAIIEDLHDGTLDEVAATQNLVSIIRKEKQKTRRYYRLLGQIESIAFWDTFLKFDLYLVSFKSGRVVYRIRRNDGELKSFKYRTIVLDD